ncbi:MAG TPA: RNA polymerase sigma factor [Gemmatimonadales bacterium]|nr:RNA polymerase sigma factor [Gemmatimonadales bacterium]
MEPLITDPPEDDLHRLVCSSRRGDAGAFEELVHRVIGPVQRWASRLARDPDDADDVTQLVLIRLQQRLDAFEGRSRFTSWLYRMTWNVAADRRVQHQRRRALREAHHAGHEIPVGAPPAVEATLDAEGLTRVVRRYRRELTARERDVFDLVDLRDRTPTEAASQLGIAASTARVLLVRARRKIRLAMLREHPDLLEDYTNAL